MNAPNPLQSQISKQAFKCENSKCPGLDGIPAEFFKALWPEIGQDLLEIFKQSQDTGKLPESMRLAVIQCIPKKGDLTEVKNWRPISLLNADYKIFASVIANRYSIHLPSVISPFQTVSHLTFSNCNCSFAQNFSQP